jgi:hypothetical protein
MCLPINTPLIRTAPRARVSRIPENWVPRRSDRLAVKSVYREPQPEKQARRVLLNKWNRRPEHTRTMTPDATVAARFHAVFASPLSSSKRAAMWELFPGATVKASAGDSRR